MELLSIEIRHKELKIMGKEELTIKPPAGISTLERAISGSQVATEQVLELAPELGTRPPAGLSSIEWAQIGLKGAEEKVKKVVTG